jgi:hypothetical protein
MSYGFEMDDAAWDEADNYVKAQKETLVDGVACACCKRDNVVSEWDVSTRDGNCADCFWGRCPKGDENCDARVKTDEF